MPAPTGWLGVCGEEVCDGDAGEPYAVAGLVCGVDVVEPFFGEDAE